MKCGIVILNYNDFETTKKLLDLICDYKVLKKIVVVDNHSTDDSYQKLCRYRSEKIVILQAPKNGGYSKGNNIGIKYLLNNTDVEIVCISNADVKFDEDFVKKILSDFKKQKDFAVLTGLQMNPEGGIAEHPFWEEYTTKRYFKMQILTLWPLNHILKRNIDSHYAQQKLKQRKEFFQVGAVEGSLFFIRSEVLEKIGFLDERVFLYNEENILAKKIKVIGSKIGVDTTVKYIHYGSVTIKKVLPSKQKLAYLFQSSIYYFNHYQSRNKLLHSAHFFVCILKRIHGYAAILKSKIFKSYIE